MKVAIILTVCIGIVLASSSNIKVEQVKLNESAILPCEGSCSGVVQWTCEASKDIVAQYDQHTCKSEKGYELSYDRVLSGDLSLTIPSADFSNKGWYTCSCNGIEICTVSLRIESYSLSTEITPAEPLVLKLPIREPVEVLYDSADAASPSRKKICTVDGRSLQCQAEYKQRVSLVCSLELREMTSSDDGNYIIKDTKNEEDILNYKVKVKGQSSVPRELNCSEHTTWTVVALLITLVALIVAVLFIIRQYVQIKRLRRDSRL